MKKRSKNGKNGDLLKSASSQSVSPDIKKPSKAQVLIFQPLKIKETPTAADTTKNILAYARKLSW